MLGPQIVQVINVDFWTKISVLVSSWMFCVSSVRRGCWARYASGPRRSTLRPLSDQVQLIPSRFLLQFSVFPHIGFS